MYFMINDHCKSMCCINIVILEQSLLLSNEQVQVYLNFIASLNSCHWYNLVIWGGVLG